MRSSRSEVGDWIVACAHDPTDGGRGYRDRLILTIMAIDKTDDTYTSSVLKVRGLVI